MQLYETTLPGGAWLRGWVRDATESMPDFNVRPAVLVLPGGGYAHCSVREGDPVAARFLAAGYQVFLLNYTVAEDPARAPLGYAPLTDVARALLHLRRHAAALRLDPARVAVCGFSAGGHLAACSALLAGDVQDRLDLRDGETIRDARPDAVLLSYPVITTGPLTHPGSADNLALGDPALRARFSLEDRVADAPDLPPFFLWHTVADELVPVENSLMLARALQRRGACYELHIFPGGAHGSSLCTREVGCPNAHNRVWMELALTWLADVFDYHL